ncbi:hypothetical protein PSECIP111854_03407 [Pseudoalteromonas sp. CIP111854]|uniref:Uncharacterized protein n=1 Tax=Pseudoalteromonas holothuriae TaxID=2963714 RepID=A0A9W4R1T0_9GAMM|nr:hypothetical protein [Pseudoalteromonas sp. CIP111854]CAH9064269.1 hypothetical protein PSECIP111854_03407 [Pseudoalteromonas sp. CIP111854]
MPNEESELFIKIKEEAIRFRKLLEDCDKENTNLVIDCFPIMSCKLSSLLLSYHFLKLWPALEVKGITAITGENSDITHYWLEVDDIVVDITGDQYNLIDEVELNQAIVKSRPFDAVHVSKKDESYLYSLFGFRETEPLKYGFPTIAEDFIEDMEFAYNQLLQQKECM